MPKQGKGTTAPKAAPRRMSKKAELEAHNGTLTVAPKANVEQPKEEVEQPKLEILLPTDGDMEAIKTVRKFSAKVTIDQIGLKDREGNLVDANNNILKVIHYESEGDRVDIAQAAGRIANELSAYYMAVKGKGINRAAGFNVNLTISDEVNGEQRWERFTVVEKLRMNNSIDIAWAVGNAVLRQIEGDNADAMFTGDFRVGEDTGLFLSKLKFDKNRLNMPLEQIYKLLDEKRKIVKKNVQTNVKALREEMK